MGIFGFGDNSDYSVEVFQSDPKPRKNGTIPEKRWYWKIMDADDQTRLLPPMRGRHSGWADYDAAQADAREVVNGLGGDFRDLDEV